MNGSSSHCHAVRRTSKAPIPSSGISPKLIRLAVILGCLLAVSGPLSGQGLDVFHERLYQDAVRSASQSRHQEAIKYFRLACFGMLEKTDRLGDCLARLAIAQAEVDKKDDFVATVTRLMDVERRFQGYSRSALPQAQKLRFETRLEELAPLELYATIPAFKSQAEGRRASQLRLQPAEERQKVLDRLIAQEPRNALWRILRGELMLEQGRAVEAVEIADRLSASHPSHPDTACFRGRAQAAVGACNPGTLENLSRCSAEDTLEAAREATLRCHVQNQDWVGADGVLAIMSESQKQQRPIRDLAKETRKKRRNPPAPAPQSEPSVPEPQQVAAPEPTVSTGSSTGPGPVEQDVLESGWDILRSDARDRFEDTYDSVRSLANRHPAWAEAQHLAAELAYRLSLWDDAVSYFQRAEKIVSQKPDLQFYLAVALYKSGDQQAAAAMLDRCEPHIQNSDFVQFWVERIRNGQG